MSITRRKFMITTGTAVFGSACGVDRLDEGLRDVGDAASNDVSGHDAAADLVDAAPGDTEDAVSFAPDPAEVWDPEGPIDAALFPRGVVVGDVTATAALVSVWSETDAVSLSIAVGGELGWEPMSTTNRLTTEAGWIEYELSDLQPDTSYAIIALSDTGGRSRSSRFRTALAADGMRTIRFGATSCLGGNLPWPILTRASEERLDFFCLLGDTIYADWGERVGFEAKWREALAVQGFRDLAASTSLVATWDDHEVDNNWTPETMAEETVAESLQMFRKAIPQRRGPNGTSLWHKLSWGGSADVFVLDCRGERRGGRYMSDSQLEWLIDGLVTSTAAFKIILNSVPITDWESIILDIQAEDRWQGFPEQRSQLLSAVGQVPGVLWLTGDFHFGAIGQVDALGGPAQDHWEVMCGPGGSEILEYAQVLSPNSQIPVLVKTQNATLFEADPVSGEVRVRFVDNDGAIIEEMSLNLFPD